MAAAREVVLRAVRAWRAMDIVMVKVEEQNVRRSVYIPSLSPLFLSANCSPNTEASPDMRT